jgi:hypothetical protein
LAEKLRDFGKTEEPSKPKEKNNDTENNNKPKPKK